MSTRLPSPAQLRQNPTRLPETVRESAQRIRAGSNYNAFITLLEPRALEQADAVASRLLAGENLPLGGWIVAVKDNIAIKGIRTTCGSKILENFESLYSATAIQRLEEAGAIVLGKTNLDEFAMGSSTENSAFGPARHPLDPDRVPGGSSGGSAVAVAAGWVHAALGSETGGSVRQPASFCGIVGLKPTYGRISRYGLVAFGSSLDQISPFAETCQSVYDILCVMAGADEFDASSAVTEAPKSHILRDSAGKLRIGLPREYLIDGLEAEVAQSINKVIERLRSAGHELIEVSLPHTRYAIPVYYIVATAEASSNLARFDGIRYGLRKTGESLVDLYELTRQQGFGPEVRRRIMMGTYVLSAGYYDAYYRKAQQVRRLIRDDFTNAFKTVDLLLTPTSPTTAFKLGEKVSDPVSMYLSDIFTAPANLAGVPALSVPAGVDSRGLPIGVQLTGPAFSEELICRLGCEIEDLLAA